MKNDRLDLLKRELKGKRKREDYSKLFSRFDNAHWLDLKSTDEILAQLKELAKDIQARNEFLLEEDNFIESDLLREVFQELSDFDRCYIFTDDYEYCGMYVVNSKDAFKQVFDIAKESFENTCFLLDECHKFYFRVNYYDETHNDYPNQFDIERNI